MTTSEYVKKLIRTNGLDKAKVIAKRSMNASTLDAWNDLPKGRGGVFTDDVGKKAKGITHREYLKTHHFWKEVYGVLGKIK